MFSKIMDEVNENIASCLRTVKTQFQGKEIDLKERVGEILPLHNFNIISATGTPEKFKTLIACALHNESDIEIFIKNYCAKNNETLRKKTPRKPGERSEYAFIYYYRCHHKTYNQRSMNSARIIREKPSRRQKNTDCPYSLIFKLKKDSDADFPCELDVEYNHNHPTQAGQTFPFEDIPKEMVDRIFTLFALSYTPGSAYKEILKSLRNECSNDVEFHEKMSHRSKIPRRGDFNQLYTQYKIKKYGSRRI